ncbi:MAG: exodeoxyribonuclease VII large subunit [Clostridia bacterium]|nr:exodeoxyribonuclease VII large subunit [Clostridia bacterium]
MAVSYRFDENGNPLMPEPKTITWVNEYVKSLLEEEMQLQDIYVSAEISNFKHHSSGHMYFTLKDESSEIKAVMFRAYASKIRFKPENGMKVLIHARLGVYEKLGSYQLYVDSMEPEGLGALYLAFEQLKAKLSAEGLFDAEHKKEIPKLPSKIGIITSPTGAAVRDIIKVAKKRCPSVSLILFPSAVQGVNAPEELTRAIEYFNLLQNVDLIIIGRGGGSVEDLWAFNDERLARAIYNCTIPVISAVGHEIDFTICDFVADFRAATPSHAAEIATPNILELKNRISICFSRAFSAITRKIENYKELVLTLKESKVLKSPQVLFDTKRMQLLTIAENMTDAITKRTTELRYKLAKVSAQLDALSPLSVLARGYGAIYDSDGNVIKGTNELEINDKIIIKMTDGTIGASVDSLEREGIRNAN